mgnify:CR=1 FL=1
MEAYCEHFNGARAAREAGYAESHDAQQASRLLSDPDISEMVEERLDNLAMSSAEATKRMADIARADIGDFFEVTHYTADDGEERTRLVLDREAVIEDGGGIIQEISWDKNGRPKVKLYDAQKALKGILKAHGAFNHDQRHELTGEDGEPVQVIFDDNVPEPNDLAND